MQNEFARFVVSRRLNSATESILCSYSRFFAIINSLENRGNPFSFFRHSRNSLSGIRVKKGNGKSGFPTETFGNDALGATFGNDAVGAALPQLID
jgi:hypothetical protein